MGKDYTIETTEEVFVCQVSPEELQRMRDEAANLPEGVTMEITVCNDLEEVARVLSS